MRNLPAGNRFEDVDLVVLQGLFGVAENGAVWITDAQLPDRVLPFITQNLVLIVNRASLVPTLTEAYQEIGSAHYEFGMFVAGPSKTADIEQSLVLGAHGPKTMTVVLLGWDGQSKKPVNGSSSFIRQIIAQVDAILSTNKNTSKAANRTVCSAQYNRPQTDITISTILIANDFQLTGLFTIYQ
jgi:hypothetical protein